MTTNKQEKYGDRLLFHATDSSLVEAACRRNLDFEASDTAAYGHGLFMNHDFYNTLCSSRLHLYDQKHIQINVRL